MTSLRIRFVTGEWLPDWTPTTESSYDTKYLNFNKNDMMPPEYQISIIENLHGDRYSIYVFLSMIDRLGMIQF